MDNNQEEKDPQKELEEYYAKADWINHSFSRVFISSLKEKKETYFQNAIVHSQEGKDEMSRWFLASANAIDEIIELLTTNNKPGE